MKKTLQIHIGGRHFHMNEDAYQDLSHYLDKLKAHFAADGESGREIVDDIEHRIAELLENRISEGKQAVTAEDVTEIIGILGKVEDFVYTDQSDDSHQAYDAGENRDGRRFYRDPDNSYLGGVASGLGAYFNIDPLWIRLAFVAMVFFNLAFGPLSVKGFGILIYVILWIVVPKARTTSEKLRMQGIPVNLGTIKESVNAEYNKVKSGLHDLKSSPAADRTRDALDNVIRAVGLVFLAIFKILFGLIGVVFLIIGSVIMVTMLMFLFGFTNIFGHWHIWNGTALPDLSQLFVNSGHYYLVVIAFIVLVFIPIVALIYGGIKIIFNIKTKHKVLRAFVLTAWILALILFVTLIMVNSSNFSVEASGSQTEILEKTRHQKLYIGVSDNTVHKKMTVYSIFDHKFNYSEWDESLYSRPELHIDRSADDQIHLNVDKRVKNVGINQSQRFLDRIDYSWEQQDSALVLDRYMRTDDEDFWMFGKVDIRLLIPENQVVVIEEVTCELLNYHQRYRYCTDSLLTGKESVMTADGLMLLEKLKSPARKNK
jgi:phage shock protein PspC (stress-responsive transcriptional regulator)